MRRFFISGVLLLLGLLGSYEILSLWKGLYSYQKNPEKKKLLLATQINPLDPDPFYRLGLFYQWDLREADLRRSKEFLLKAIERNPLEQRYWTNLARVLQRLGEVDASEKALEKAVSIYPTGYLGRWVSANLLLERGEFEKARPHLSYLLQHYPNQTATIYDLLFKWNLNLDIMLDQVVPRDPSSFKHFIDYLYQVGEKEGLKKAWVKRVAFDWKPDRKETLRYIEFLIRQGSFGEAFQVWTERLREEGIVLPSDGNLITNPGFEEREILGGGFDWRMEKVAGAEISFDSDTVFEGKRALKIVFDGKENIDFYHLYQYVAWKPDRDYLLRARLKTQALTTKSGIKIEVVSADRKFHLSSEMLTGENDWKEIRIPFRTPKGSEGGMVRLRRERTEKFDRFISGSVWLDQVSLKEKRD